ncbi:MAG: ABC transporter substrate-binding protein [Proteobacteria bacterium]|nr:ABC transporter substrate-binding protein [Pseudomonadota bacterium]
MAIRDRARISRRSVLKGAGAAATAATVGFPHVARAQNKPIKIGMVTIQSGRVAMIGSSSAYGAQMMIDKFNEAGGLNGRKIEMIARDSKGKPDEATRLAREFVNSDGCEILFTADTSAAGFALQEVARELGVLTLHNTPETSSLTADPKLKAPTAFRCARQGIHDSIACAQYAAKIAKEKGIKRWMGCSPDYAYGRDLHNLFFEYMKQFAPDTELVGESWPKLFQPDYTEQLTKILQAKPQALYSALWGGDLTAFIDQGSIFNLFSQMQVFAINVADYAIVSAVKNLPQGIHSGTRYLASYPATDANKKWAADYLARFKEHPLNWSWENNAGAQFVTEAIKKTGSTDSKKLSEAIAGMTIDSPFGVDNKLTMRAEDHTLINYACGWGQTISKEPFLPNVTPSDWKQILELEVEWKKKNKYL